MSEQEWDCDITKLKGYKIGTVLCPYVLTLNLAKHWEAGSFLNSIPCRDIQPFNLLFHLPKRMYNIQKLDYVFITNLQWICNKCNSSACVWCGRECCIDVCASDVTLDNSFNLYFLNFGMRVLLFPSWGCTNQMKFFLCEAFVTPHEVSQGF